MAINVSRKLTIFLVFIAGVVIGMLILSSERFVSSRQVSLGGEPLCDTTTPPHAAGKLSERSVIEHKSKIVSDLERNVTVQAISEGSTWQNQLDDFVRVFKDLYSESLINRLQMVPAQLNMVIAKENDLGTVRKKCAGLQKSTFVDEAFDSIAPGTCPTGDVGGVEIVAAYGKVKVTPDLPDIMGLVMATLPLVNASREAIILALSEIAISSFEGPATLRSAATSSARLSVIAAAEAFLCSSAQARNNEVLDMAKKYFEKAGGDRVSSPSLPKRQAFWEATIYLLVAARSVNLNWESHNLQEGPMEDMLRGRFTKARQIEYDETLQWNICHPCVHKIHLHFDSEDDYEHFQNAGFDDTCSKVRPVVLQRRMQYNDALSYANQELKGVPSLITNADIYLGRGFCSITRKLLDTERTVQISPYSNKARTSPKHTDKDVYALSRRERPDPLPGKIHCCSEKYWGCHDAFVIVPEIKRGVIDRLNLRQNTWGAENKVIGAFHEEGYLVINPCKSFQIFHNHATNIRPDQVDKRVKDSYRGQAYPMEITEHGARYTIVGGADFWLSW